MFLFFLLFWGRCYIPPEVCGSLEWSTCSVCLLALMFPPHIHFMEYFKYICEFIDDFSLVLLIAFFFLHIEVSAAGLSRFSFQNNLFLSYPLSFHIVIYNTNWRTFVFLPNGMLFCTPSPKCLKLTLPVSRLMLHLHTILPFIHATLQKVFCCMCD